MFIVDMLTLRSVWDDFQHGTKVHIQDRGFNKKILKSVYTEQNFL